jgi:hypothetical protein
MWRPTVKQSLISRKGYDHDVESRNLPMDRRPVQTAIRTVLCHNYVCILGPIWHIIKKPGPWLSWSVTRALLDLPQKIDELKTESTETSMKW